MVGDPSYRRIESQTQLCVGRGAGEGQIEEEEKKEGQEKMGRRNSANRTRGGERRR